MSIAVIVINYNYGAYLQECLLSISANDNEDLRVIIVDDASTDNSVDVVKTWASTQQMPVQIIAKAKNAGPASAYNTARCHLKDSDTFICFIDADDAFLTNRFTAQMAAMRGRDDLAVVYSDARRFGVGIKDEVRHRSPPDQGESVTTQILRSFFPSTLHSALIRRTAFEQIPLFDEALRLCDFPLWLMLSRVGGFKYIPGVVAAYRIHSSSMMRSEVLISDLLSILGQHAQTPPERVAARVRGRAEMNKALVSGNSPRLGALARYGVGTRDWRALPVAVATRLPGSTWIINKLHPRGSHHAG